MTRRFGKNVAFAAGLVQIKCTHIRSSWKAVSFPMSCLFVVFHWLELALRPFCKSNFNFGHAEFSENEFVFPENEFEKKNNPPCGQKLSQITETRQTAS